MFASGRIITWVALVGCIMVVQVIAQNTVLRQVIVVSRHGVRGPFGLNGKPPTKTNLEPYSRSQFPFETSGKAWGTSDDPHDTVAPKLTKHGAGALEEMGKYFRKFEYATLFGNKSSSGTPLNKKDCENIAAFSDDNERDNATAHHFLRGFAPECTDVLITNAGVRDLFPTVKHASKSCRNPGQTEIAGIIGQNTTKEIVRRLDFEISDISKTLDCCKEEVCLKHHDGNYEHSANCTLKNIPYTWIGESYAPFNDPLFKSQYFSEWFLLQALNGMELKPDGSNHEDKSNVSQHISEPTHAEGFLQWALRMSALHVAQMEIMTNEVSAANFGSTLLVHVLASMEKTIRTDFDINSSGARQDPGLVQSRGNRLLYYAAHDTNIGYLQKLLRITWEAPNWWPNQVSLGGMIIFELHCMLSSGHRSCDDEHDPSAYFVKAFYQTATPNQISGAHGLSPEYPPSRIPLTLPLCSAVVNGELRCPYQLFQQRVSRALNTDCVSKNLQPFASSLNSTSVPGNNEQGRIGGWNVFGILVGFIFCFTLGVISRNVARDKNLKLPFLSANEKPSSHYAPLDPFVDE